MKPITEMLPLKLIEQLASRSNYRFGKNIAEDGEIKITKENTFNRIATVKRKNASPQTVELMSTSKGLRYKCSCSAKKDNFCEHCVALALYLQPKSMED
jgi:uncharacterized Zn finger protein